MVRPVDYVDITGCSASRRHQTKVGGENEIYSSLIISHGNVVTHLICWYI